MLELLVQALIGILGVGAIWLSGCDDTRRRRWGFTFGLCSQPLWFYEAISHGQWGILALSVCYAWAWGRGAYHLWMEVD